MGVTPLNHMGFKWLINNNHNLCALWNALQGKNEYPEQQRTTLRHGVTWLSGTVVLTQQNKLLVRSACLTEKMSCHFRACNVSVDCS